MFSCFCACIVHGNILAKFLLGVKVDNQWKNVVSKYKRFTSKADAAVLIYCLHYLSSNWIRTKNRKYQWQKQELIAALGFLLTVFRYNYYNTSTSVPTTVT